jgi:hypothetical protein
LLKWRHYSLAVAIRIGSLSLHLERQMGKSVLFLVCYQEWFMNSKPLKKTKKKHSRKAHKYFFWEIEPYRRKCFVASPGGISNNNPRMCHQAKVPSLWDNLCWYICLDYPRSSLMGGRSMTLDASRAVFARFGSICGKCGIWIHNCTR